MHLFSIDFAEGKLIFRDFLELEFDYYTRAFQYDHNTLEWSIILFFQPREKQHENSRMKEKITLVDVLDMF